MNIFTKNFKEFIKNTLNTLSKLKDKLKVIKC
jgi:hypothetical protein